MEQFEDLKKRQTMNNKTTFLLPLNWYNMIESSVKIKEYKEIKLGRRIK